MAVRASRKRDTRGPGFPDARGCPQVRPLVLGPRVVCGRDFLGDAKIGSASRAALIIGFQSGDDSRLTVTSFVDDVKYIVKVSSVTHVSILQFCNVFKTMFFNEISTISNSFLRITLFLFYSFLYFTIIFFLFNF